MRTYGRVYDELGNPSWQVVTTDKNGNNDAVYLVTLIQVLKLNLGESPFYGNYGIPAMQTVMTQVFPDFYAAQAQTQFSPFFAKCIVQRVQQAQVTDQAPGPLYSVSVTPHFGALIPSQVPS